MMRGSLTHRYAGRARIKKPCRARSRMLNGTHCRSCGQDGLHPVLSLGCTPLADALRTREQLAERERSFPLNVSLCGGCGLMQIRETVPAEELFCRDYPYFACLPPALLHGAGEKGFALI